MRNAEIEQIIDEVESRLPRPGCRTCDCFRGFLTQLQLDADEDISAVTEPLTIPCDELHGCLGCDPCPPGEAYAAYVARKREHQ